MQWQARGQQLIGLSAGTKVFSDGESIRLLHNLTQYPGMLMNSPQAGQLDGEQSTIAAQPGKCTTREDQARKQRSGPFM